MSSPIAGLLYDVFKPELWSAELNYSLKKAQVSDAFVNRNYEGEIKQMGDVVHIVEPGAVVTAAYVAYQDITWSRPTGIDRTLVIDQADYFALDVDDIDEVQAKPNLIQAHAREASYALSNVMDAFVFRQYTAAGSGIGSSQGVPVTLTANNIYQYFVDAAKVFDVNNVPNSLRRAAVSPSEVALLRMAPQLVPVVSTVASAAFVGGGTGDKSAQVVSTGLIGSIAGFEVYETNNLTTISGVRKILFSTPLATTFAQQIIEMETLRRENRFADGIKGLNVYGMSTIRAESLAVLSVNP